MKHIKENPIIKIPVSDIKISSCLYLKAPWTTIQNQQAPPSGPLFKNPIMVYQYPGGHYGLIDGLSRLNASQEKSVLSHIIPETTDTRSLLLLIYSQHYYWIHTSLITKLIFLQFITQQPDSKNQLSEWCIKLEINNHKSFKTEMSRILKLSKDLLIFAHEKQYSLKQCLNLAYFSSEVIDTIFSHKNQLHLSASSLVEVCRQTRTLCHRRNCTASYIWSTDTIQKILKKGDSPGQKTQLIRRYLDEQCNPTLVKQNKKIKDIARSIETNKIKVSWDEALEHKELELGIKIKEKNDISGIINQLNSEFTISQIERILETL